MRSTPTTRTRSRPRTPPDSRTPRGLLATSLVAIVLAGLCISGCGYTSSPALLPTHLKTVAIPTFVNGTTEVGLEQEITQAVIDAFVKDNHLRVVDEKSANALLVGKVTAYRDGVFGFTSAAEATEYRSTVSVHVTFKDLVKNREVWDDEIEKSANYFVKDVPGQKAKTTLEGRQDAVSKIADEILSRSVEGW